MALFLIALLLPKYRSATQNPGSLPCLWIGLRSRLAMNERGHEIFFSRSIEKRSLNFCPEIKKNVLFKCTFFVSNSKFTGSATIGRGGTKVCHTFLLRLQKIRKILRGVFTCTPPVAPTFPHIKVIFPFPRIGTLSPSTRLYLKGFW